MIVFLQSHSSISFSPSPLSKRFKRRVGKRGIRRRGRELGRGSEHAPGVGQSGGSRRRRVGAADVASPPLLLLLLAARRARGGNGCGSRGGKGRVPHRQGRQRGAARRLRGGLGDPRRRRRGSRSSRDGVELHRPRRGVLRRHRRAAPTPRPQQQPLDVAPLCRGGHDLRGRSRCLWSRWSCCRGRRSLFVRPVVDAKGGPERRGGGRRRRRVHGHPPPRRRGRRRSCGGGSRGPGAVADRRLRRGPPPGDARHHGRGPVAREPGQRRGDDVLRRGRGQGRCRRLSDCGKEGTSI